MAVSAYILIQTEVGKASLVVDACRTLTGVVQADDVTGPYDVILRAEAGSIDELGKMVVSQVQLVAGITRTLTCPVVHL
jgi:DNA-binding Lrp family transcriptional regulator